MLSERTSPLKIVVLPPYLWSSVLTSILAPVFLSMKFSGLET